MINPFDLEIARERHEELLREAWEHRIAAALRKARRSRSGVRKGLEGVEFSLELAEEESVVLAMPHHRTLRR
jgi:hypothetical protein